MDAISSVEDAAAVTSLLQRGIAVVAAAEVASLSMLVHVPHLDALLGMSQPLHAETSTIRYMLSCTMHQLHSCEPASNIELEFRVGIEISSVDGCSARVLAVRFAHILEIWDLLAFYCHGRVVSS